MSGLGGIRAARARMLPRGHAEGCVFATCSEKGTCVIRSSNQYVGLWVSKDGDNCLLRKFRALHSTVFGLKYLVLAYLFPCKLYA